MAIIKTRETMLVPTVEEVPRISDAERAELVASLKKSRAQIAAGDCDVVGPDTLRQEFDAIMQGDPSDAELDALLGITPQPPR